jgi:hypothetical protein
VSVLVDFLRFANLFLFAIVMGTYTFEWLVVSRAVRGRPPERSAEIHDALFHHLPNRYMPWAGITAAIATAILIVLGRQSGLSTAFYAAGLVLGLTSAVTTFRFSRKIDLEISAWRSDPTSGDYSSLRRRWDRLIAFRAPLGQLGFACFVVATLAI